MSDPFAELGLPRKFDQDPAALRAAGEKSGNSPAYQAVADPRQRAETLLGLMQGPTKEFWKGVPEDFPAALAAAGTDPAKLAALRDQRITNITFLFRQILSPDKGPVQAGRQRMVRAELNALDQLAPLLPK
jgi:uncharacterized protein YfiM (DUF2279 family)